MNNPCCPCVIEIAVEPKSKADQEKLGIGLQKLAAEDPSFRVTTDEESGQTRMAGMGELHLDILVDRLKREFKVEANIGQPQVAYRETLGQTAEIVYTHKKQSGGSGQFAEVKIIFEPLEPGSGFEFESKIVGGPVPKDYIPGVEKGIRSVMEGGLIAGFPLIDFKATLIDGKYHDVDSSVLAFEIAARAAFKEAKGPTKPKLLEPMMAVEVCAAQSDMNYIADDFGSRCLGSVHKKTLDDAAIVSGLVPMAKLFGYPKCLKAKVTDAFVAQINFSHYQPVSESEPQGPDDLYPTAMAMRA